MEAAFYCDDILQQILLRMPARSLIRLMCVSRHWLDLISSPSFSHTHVTYHGSFSVSGFYFYTDHRFMIHPVPLHRHQRLPPLSFPDIKYDFHVLHSCNGLVLCGHRNKKIFSVSNPTTQKYTLIPRPTSIDKLSFDYYFLAFDPKNSLYYKIVLVRLTNDSYWRGTYVIHTYSSEDKSWRSVKHYTTTSRSLQPNAFWNGSVHWLNGSHVQYDVDAEKLEETPLPPNVYGSNICFLGECCGNLILIEKVRDNMKGYRIYEMGRDSRCWMLKIFGNVWPVESKSLKDRDFHVLSIVKGKHKGDILLVLADMTEVFCYNTKLNTMEELYDNAPFRVSPYRVAHHFIESLFPV